MYHSHELVRRALMRSMDKLGYWIVPEEREKQDVGEVGDVVDVSLARARRTGTHAKY